MDNEWANEFSIQGMCQPDDLFNLLQSLQASYRNSHLSSHAGDPDARISDVGGKLELLVSCTPAVVAEGSGDESRNLDYIRASSVPYTVYVRKAPRGAMNARPPEFDELVCDAE